MKSHLRSTPKLQRGLYRTSRTVFVQCSYGNAHGTAYSARSVRRTTHGAACRVTYPRGWVSGCVLLNKFDMKVLGSALGCSKGPPAGPRVYRSMNSVFSAFSDGSVLTWCSCGTVLYFFVVFGPCVGPCVVRCSNEIDSVRDVRWAKSKEEGSLWRVRMQIN